MIIRKFNILIAEHDNGSRDFEAYEGAELLGKVTITALGERNILTSFADLLNIMHGGCPDPADSGDAS